MARSPSNSEPAGGCRARPAQDHQRRFVLLAVDAAGVVDEILVLGDVLRLLADKQVERGAADADATGRSGDIGAICALLPPGEEPQRALEHRGDERAAFVRIVDEAVDPHPRARADPESRTVEQQDLQLRALAGVDLVAPGETLPALDFARVPDRGIAHLDVADDGRGIADLDPLGRGRIGREGGGEGKAGDDSLTHRQPPHRARASARSWRP